MFFKSNKKLLKIGLSQNEHYICAVLNKINTIKIRWYDKQHHNLQNVLTSLNMRYQNAKVIYSISDQFIWRKYVFFPIHYTKNMIYRQIIELLKQELPISLENIYFDYQVTKEEQKAVYKVILYALIKNQEIKKIINQVTILDSEYFCYLRGIHYLAEQQGYDLVNIEEHGFIFNTKLIQIKPTELCVTDLVKFSQELECKRFVLLKKRQIFDFIAGKEKIELTVDSEKEMVNSYLYVTALGATLWNGKGLI